jgi:hypothetical protein
VPLPYGTELSGYGVGYGVSDVPSSRFTTSSVFRFARLNVDSACLRLRGHGRFLLGLCLSYLHSKMPPGEPTQVLALYAS